jgi:hypothetical protein
MGVSGPKYTELTIISVKKNSIFLLPLLGRDLNGNYMINKMANGKISGQKMIHKPS